MKKYTKIVSLFLSFFFLIGMMTFLASCDSNKEFKIMFTDYDGSVLYSEQVKKGKMPSFIILIL